MTEIIHYFKKLNPVAVAPYKKHSDDSGLDLTCIEKLNKVGVVEFFDTGIALQPSSGYYYELVPRSSITGSGYILANSIGILDTSYRGSIKVPLIKVDSEAKELTVPFTIVQLIPRKVEQIKLVEITEELEQSNRDKDGGINRIIYDNLV